MRKISILAMLLCSLCMMAQEEPIFNRICVNLTNTAALSQTDAAYLFEYEEATSGFDDGFDVVKGFVGGNLFVYSITNYGKQADLFDKCVEGTYIGVKTKYANEATYRFSFSEIEDAKSAFTYYLLDKQENKFTLINETSTYEFVAEANYEKDDRFQIVALPYYTRYVASGNWATVCFPYKFMSESGVDKLYTLTAINTAGTKVAIDEVAIANVVAGTPYIFQSDSIAQEFKYMPANKVDNPVVEGTNGLNGVFADSTLTEQKWVITNNAVTPAAAGSFVPQYRCFIDLGQTLVDDAAFTQQVPGRRIFNVKNTPTDVEMLEEAPAMPIRKVIINGQLVIIKDNKMFNAQGGRL